MKKTFVTKEQVEKIVEQFPTPFHMMKKEFVIM